MSANTRRPNSQDMPPDPDEGYWSALLNEGEFTGTTMPDDAQVDDQFDTSSESPFNGYTHPPIAVEIGSDWAKIQTIAENDQVIDLKVVGYNRGGLLVEWRSLRGFVPASQLNQFPAAAHPNARRDSLVNRIGQTLTLRVIELNPEKNRLILSERAAQAAPGERSTILHKLQIGDTVTGTITNLCDFGAFVDLGGLEGLIHISELSWGRVGHPADILKRGQDVKAYVLDVNPDEERIALSIKRLHPDPWATVQDRYHPGEIVQGVITNVVDFGAFACIEEGLEGLIHISELAEGHFLHPRNVVSEGQTVSARILNIDGKARRLGLSLRLVE